MGCVAGWHSARVSEEESFQRGQRQDIHGGAMSIGETIAVDSAVDIDALLR